MLPGQKHLVKCRCILSQFKKQDSPPFHQFVVFSGVDDEGNVVQKYSQCNNCGVIHRIVDICTSQIVDGKEHMNSLVTIDDIRCSIHANLASILDKNNCDIPTWEACQYILENKQWGQHVVLTSDLNSELKSGKYVRILGDSLFKVEGFERSEVVSHE